MVSEDSQDPSDGFRWFIVWVISAISMIPDT